MKNNHEFMRIVNDLIKIRQSIAEQALHERTPEEYHYIERAWGHVSLAEDNINKIIKNQPWEDK